ncbi:hypothetical protein HYQ44_012776 [Verticillium longisporum]|nr:hypothetical protein HYQ44_012776 [Verticillium longisporum]
MRRGIQKIGDGLACSTPETRGHVQLTISLRLVELGPAAAKGASYVSKPYLSCYGKLQSITQHTRLTFVPRPTSISAPFLLRPEYSSSITFKLKIYGVRS